MTLRQYDLIVSSARRSECLQLRSRRPFLSITAMWCVGMHLQSGCTHEREELAGHTKPRARSVTSVRGFYEVREQYSLAWVFRKEKSLFTLDCKFCEQL
jgi:hypothetical protein